MLTFIYNRKDLVPNTDHFEHPQFVRAIGAGLFWDPESLGVAFKDRFKVVPLPAVALILTMVSCESKLQTSLLMFGYASRCKSV